MRGARRCLEHGKASIETVGYIDLCARKRDADALVGWHTDVVDDDPQLIPVGGRGRMRQIRDSGEDQPMVAAKQVTLCKRNPSETLLIAG